MILTPPQHKNYAGKYKKTSAVFLQDELVSTLASLLSVLSIRGVSNPIPSFSSRLLFWLFTAIAASAAGILLFGIHKDVRRYATVRTIGRTLCAVACKEAGLLIVLCFGLLPLAGKAFYVLLIFVDFCLSAGGLFYLRVVARIYTAEHNQKSSVLKKAQSRTVLVQGTERPSIEMAHALEKEGYEVVGLLTTNAAMEGRVISDYIVYAFNTEEDLSRLQWRLGGVDCIFFPHQLEEPMPTEPKEVPQVDGMSFAEHVVKRSFDIAMSALLLLVFSPVILICALAIKLEDGGPVIFSQERIGRDAKPFYIYKFRSMRTDAEKDGVPELYTGDEDPRLTRTGRFLRVHHLDELPQLWNVFIGDMSFIGYRPEREYYIEQIMERNARYRYLYQIRPGVTSYATLYNGYTDTLDKMLTRLDLDLYYLRNHSLWFDAKVLGLTFLSIVSGKKF